MVKSENKEIARTLCNSIYWMGRCNDYFERSLVLTKVLGLIKSIADNRDTYFEMDFKYCTIDNDKFRYYKDRLNKIIDIDNPTTRMEEAYRFYEFLHDIRMLRDV